MNGFLQKLATSYMHFMQGRRGIDDLNIILFILGVILSLASSIFNIGWLSVVGLIAWAFCVYRFLSKDTNKRALENEAFRRKDVQAKRKVDRSKKMWANRKTTGYITCSKCKTNLSYPKGMGTLRLTCPKCKNVFEVNSGKPKK